MLNNERFLSYDDYSELVRAYPYYRNRWHYLAKAIEMIEGEELANVIELGPGPANQSIVNGAKTMGLHPDSTYVHDATGTPFPFADKQHDLFVALQVFEHLKGKQKEAFNEVRRTSKAALLSFPLNWADKIHNVTLDDIHEWTDGLKPERREYTGVATVRVICLFRF